MHADAIMNANSLELIKEIDAASSDLDKITKLLNRSDVQINDFFLINGHRNTLLSYATTHLRLEICELILKTDKIDKDNLAFSLQALLHYDADEVFKRSFLVDFFKHSFGELAGHYVTYGKDETARTKTQTLIHLLGEYGKKDNAIAGVKRNRAEMEKSSTTSKTSIVSTPFARTRAGIGSCQTKPARPKTRASRTVSPSGQ